MTRAPLAERPIEGTIQPAAPEHLLRRVSRPIFVLIAGIMLAVLSWVATAADWPLIVTVVLAAACVLAIALAGLGAVAWRSVVVAPLAVCILAFGNPLAAHAMGTFVDREVGPVSVTADWGLVFWELYPGIAGWDAPDPLPRADATTLARTAQAAIRSVVGDLTTSFGYAWSVPTDDAAGVAAIENGFGGTSMFVRVDVPQWTTEDFDGSPAQRAAILASAGGAAAQLQLTEVQNPSGDVETSDGVRTWGSSEQLLTLTIDGPRVSLVFTAGPFLSDGYLPEEYERSLRSFEGLTAPEPAGAARASPRAVRANRHIRREPARMPRRFAIRVPVRGGGRIAGAPRQRQECCGS